jgi:4Fe-4S ferredoxin
MSSKALFIELEVSAERCIYIDGCRACIQECPVDIFAVPTAVAGEKPVAAVVEENQDECTLCDLCLKDCPTEAITLRKLY